MIIGEFDGQGRPYVECRLIIPRLEIDQRTVFLVDTGADRTCLHPRDAARARIPIDQLGAGLESSGVGGASLYYPEPTLLSFDDQVYIRIYVVDLLIAAPHEGNQGLPSLLGRDLINRWYMQYDPMSERLQFTVRDADYSLEVT